MALIYRWLIFIDYDLWLGKFNGKYFEVELIFVVDLCLKHIIETEHHPLATHGCTVTQTRIIKSFWNEIKTIKTFLFRTSSESVKT